MKYLITGGCGFLGSNIAAEILRRHHDLAVFDNLSREGAVSNLEWLREQGQFEFFNDDIRSAQVVEAAVGSFQPDVIFHLAGQVAMTTSIQDPRQDFEINLMGSLNVLEAARLRCPTAMMVYSSTNKVYGDLTYLRCEEQVSRYILPDLPAGVSEAASLSFHSPYGCSKGGADQYFLDYSRVYGLSTVVFRHSSMYGGRQFSTKDQGWIGWFCAQALLQSKGKGAEFTISGDGKQVRDVLHAKDMVALYLRAADCGSKLKGKAFNVGGGMSNSLSILELLDMLSLMLGIKLAWRHISPRESDQKVFVADLSEVTAATGWKPEIDKETGVKLMLEWVSTI